MRLVFMGTPEFAVPSLAKLASARHRIEAVITPPDRPRGRGQIIGTSPVKAEAVRLGLSVLQPEDVADPEFISALKALRADCFVVVGFRILPESVFGIAGRGTINLHASLLPKYRGAAPIQWAVIRGEAETGVTTFFIQKRVDTGDLILQRSLRIGEDETAGELHDRLAETGAGLLLETLDLIESGVTRPKRQEGEASAAPKILPEHCRISWEKTAQEIHNLIRGLSPRPGAFTLLEGKRLKVYGSRIRMQASCGGTVPGSVLTDDEGLSVQTGSGCLILRDVQFEGRDRMGADEFLRGKSIIPGTRLGV
jgi:methionyl-tRNA formyltransferase